MPRIDLPGASLNYRYVGEQGPLLVLLHANPGDSRDFDGIVPVLSEHYRLLLVDWPGYGESPPLRDPDSASAMLFFTLWTELADALDLEPALFIANSVGGYVAARYAVESPERVRGLVLVSPGGFTPHNLMTRGFCQVQGSRLGVPPGWMAQVYLRKRGPVTQEMLLRARYEQSTPAVRATNRAIWRSFIDPAHDLRPLAADISQPTLLIFGKYDPLIPAGKDGKVAADLIPQATFVVTRTGHCPFAEAPADFLALVQPFLAQAARGGGSAAA